MVRKSLEALRKSLIGLKEINLLQIKKSAWSLNWPKYDNLYLKKKFYGIQTEA